MVTNNKNLSKWCIKDKYVMTFTFLPLEPIFPMIQTDYIIHYSSSSLCAYIPYCDINMVIFYFLDLKLHPLPQRTLHSCAH